MSQTRRKKADPPPVELEDRVLSRLLAMPPDPKIAPKTKKKKPSKK